MKRPGSLGQLFQCEKTVHCSKSWQTCSSPACLLPQAATYRLVFGLHSSENKLDYLVFTDYPHSICTADVCMLFIPLECSRTLGLHFTHDNSLFISVEEEEMPL